MFDYCNGEAGSIGYRRNVLNSAAWCVVVVPSGFAVEDRERRIERRRLKSPVLWIQSSRRRLGILTRSRRSGRSGRQHQRLSLLIHRPAESASLDGGAAGPTQPGSIRSAGSRGCCCWRGAELGVGGEARAGGVHSVGDAALKHDEVRQRGEAVGRCDVKV